MDSIKFDLQIFQAEQRVLAKRRAYEDKLHNIILHLIINDYVYNIDTYNIHNYESRLQLLRRYISETIEKSIEGCWNCEINDKQMSDSFQKLVTLVNAKITKDTGVFVSKIIPQ